MLLSFFSVLDYGSILNNQFDIEGYLKNQFVRRFGRAEENACLNGDGNESPAGILHSVEGAEIGLTTSEVTYDEVVKLYFSLDKAYRKNAMWLVNDERALHLRTLKDRNGNYLWNHTDNTILGRPVEYTSHMPNIESGQVPMAFGDLSFLWMVERQPLSVKVLKEKYIPQGQIGYAAYERLDVKLIVKEAVKLMKMA